MGHGVPRAAVVMALRLSCRNEQQAAESCTASMLVDAFGSAKLVLGMVAL